MKKQSGKIGNQNASKPEDQKRTSRITLVMTPREKAQCVKAAMRFGGLNAWARKKLGID
jgi:hypothetical protein